MVRLERGGSDFLRLVTTHLHGLGMDAVYSPALYPSSTDVWRRAGFDGFVSLDIMERPLVGTSFAVDSANVIIERQPNWEQVLAVDRLAFDGFWGMSRLGLREAHVTNRTSAVLVAAGADELSGYAIVGSQWATVYLHRIAVRPAAAGRGLGAALLAAALDWGARSGGNSMVLNVRPENRRATRLYERMGFARTETALEVLRHRGG
jgi:GNAT superfamily N-acetyltransferase